MISNTAGVNYRQMRYFKGVHLNIRSEILSRNACCKAGLITIEWVKNERIWSPTTSYESANGRKQLYRCNLVVQRGPQCASALHLLYHADSFQVSAYISQEEHTHEAIGKKAHGINATTKESISRLLNLKLNTKGSIKLQF